MADEADATQERTERMEALFIESQRFLGISDIDINGNGECQVCGGTVEPTMLNGKPVIGRWCSIECRNEDE